MKIGFVTNSDVRNVHAWSGTIHHMFQALQKAGLDVVPIDNLFELSKWNPYYYAKRRIYRRLFRRNYLSSRTPAVSWFYARQIERRIRNLGVDLIFSPKTGLVSHLSGSLPIVLWNDATFAALVGYHPFLRDLCAESVSDGNLIEQSAFDKARLLIFTSQWAARSALQEYHADPSKVFVVPFGANLECDRTPETILAGAKNKSRDVCKLLFIGTYWKSKGGDIALESAKRLKERGVNVELHVVGCYPPEPMADWVKTHGFISKSTPEGLQKIGTLLRTSHFLLVPTRADAFGLVFAEACSYGLPSVGTDTGGVSEIIKNGVNGFLLKPDDPPDNYAAYIEKVWSSEETYLDLSVHAFEEYQKRLNWDVAGARIKELLMGIESSSSRSKYIPPLKGARHENFL